MSLSTQTSNREHAATQDVPTPRPAAAAGPAPPAAPPPAPAPPARDALGPRLARAVLQRKSLGQLGWLPTLKPAGTRRLVGDGRPVTVYAQTEDAAHDKLDALRIAAIDNAEVGETVDNEAYAAWAETYKWAANPKWRNDKWTRGGPENFNRETWASVDPFFYEVTVPYTYHDEEHKLKLRFQHASSYTGYVETVYDSANPGATSSPSMYDFKTEGSLKGKKSADGSRNLLYSNKHDTRSNDWILAETYGDTEESFDAYTKIAGEGARWACVRNHAYNLQNHSHFYVQDPDRSMWGVTFVSLWLSWERVFNKRYNIPDSEVAAAIRNGDFGSDVVRMRRAGEKDYFLEAWND
ncbi:MAG: hypothetical protein Q8K79_05350 [Solirubrobacteraceae bacterium]|nr:hypothetical protein [Solirubrobacteraceae bacterium]